MCVRFQKIKSCGMTHPLQAFIPCGKCHQCRKREQNSWLFRLKAEIENLEKGKWYGVFATLTYDEKHIPYIPKLLHKNGVNFERVICFSKKHVRDFADNMRKYLESKGAKEYKDSGIDYRARYIICSEFGESTQRSHYHLLYIVPSFINARELFKKVKEFWTENGFVFPKDFEGGKDKHGYVHKPFVVDDLYKASHYVSKYISKDIAYMSRLDLTKYKKSVILEEKGRWKTKFYRYRGIIHAKLVLNDGKILKKDKKVRLSDYLPFHLQSRCLGKCYIDKVRSKKDEEIVNIIKNGQFFEFETFARPLPRYVINKLLFQVRYGKKDGKRIVRNFSSLFLEKNYREVFKIKVEKAIERIGSFCKMNREKTFRMVADSLAYVGIEREFIYNDPAEMWFERYFVDSFFENDKEFYFASRPNPITKERENEIRKHLKQYCEIMLKVNLSEMENARIAETQDRIKNYIIDKLTSGE